jgi:hypothetical protein
MQESVGGKIYLKCYKRLNNAKVFINFFSTENKKKQKDYVNLIITLIGWLFLALLTDYKGTECRL